MVIHLDFLGVHHQMVVVEVKLTCFLVEEVVHGGGGAPLPSTTIYLQTHRWLALVIAILQQRLIQVVVLAEVRVA